MRYIFMLVAGLLLTGCLSAAGLKSDNLGKTYSGAAEIGKDNMTVPLSDGEWVFIYNKRNLNNENDTFNHAVLIQEKDGVVDKFIFATGSMDHTDFGFFPGQVCNDDEILHMEVNSNYSGYDQDCWGIDHWDMRENDDDSTFWKKTYENVRERGLKFPETMIVGIYRVADRTKFLRVYHGVNPENKGLDPVYGPSWEDSDWNAKNLHKDPEKVKFIEDYKKWMAEWHSQVRAGFEGDLPIGQPY